MRPIRNPDFAFPNPEVPGQQGMSLRDYFAGQALCGLIASGQEPRINGQPANHDRAAYAIADAMLATREKGGE